MVYNNNILSATATLFIKTTLLFTTHQRSSLSSTPNFTKLTINNNLPLEGNIGKRFPFCCCGNDTRKKQKVCPESFLWDLKDEFGGLLSVGFQRTTFIVSI